MKQEKKKRFSLREFFKARNTRRGAVSIAITVMMIAALILLNVAVGSLSSQYSLFIDTTPNQAFRLQDVTADYAASIDKDVDFYVLADEMTFEDYGAYYIQANKLIHQLCECSSHITLHYVDPVTDPAFVKDYPEIDWKNGHLCLISCGENYRALDPDDLFDYTQDSNGYYYITAQHIEQAIASSLLMVTSDYIPTVAVLTGQGEDDASAFTSRLSNNAYNIIEVDLATEEKIPADAEFLFIYAPAVDIDDDMYDYLSDWLINHGEYGHHIVYFPTDMYDVSEFPNLNQLLADYGMKLEYGFIREDNRGNIPSTLPTPLCARFLYTNTAFTEHLPNPDISVFLYCTMPVVITDGATASPMLTSSETSFFGPISISGDFNPEYRSYHGAAIGTKTDRAGDGSRASHIVVCGSNRSLMEEFLAYKAFNNAAYFINIFNTLSANGHVNVIIEGKDLSIPVLGAESAAVVDFLTVAVRYLIPGAVLLAGLIIWLIRRHR